MKKFLIDLWKEEEGAETAEWLVTVAFIVAVAVTLYTGILQDALTPAAEYIETSVTNGTMPSA